MSGRKDPLRVRAWRAAGRWLSPLRASLHRLLDEQDRALDCSVEDAYDFESIDTFEMPGSPPCVTPPTARQARS